MCRYLRPALLFSGTVSSPVSGADSLSGRKYLSIDPLEAFDLAAEPHMTATNLETKVATTEHVLTSKQAVRQYRKQ